MEVVIERAHEQPVQAYVAWPSAPGPAVVVLHSAWGRRGDYIALCDMLAAEGFVAAAPDLFGGALATTWAEAEQLAAEHPSGTLAPAAIASGTT